MSSEGSAARTLPRQRTWARFPYPEALHAGWKRLERNAAVRGQVTIWQHLRAESGKLEAAIGYEIEHRESVLSATRCEEHRKANRTTKGALRDIDGRCGPVPVPIRSLHAAAGRASAHAFEPPALFAADGKCRKVSQNQIIMTDDAVYSEPVSTQAVCSAGIFWEIPAFWGSLADFHYHKSRLINGLRNNSLNMDAGIFLQLAGNCDVFAGGPPTETGVIHAVKTGAAAKCRPICSAAWRTVASLL